MSAKKSSTKKNLKKSKAAPKKKTKVSDVIESPKEKKTLYCIVRDVVFITAFLLIAYVINDSHVWRDFLQGIGFRL